MIRSVAVATSVVVAEALALALRTDVVDVVCFAPLRRALALADLEPAVAVLQLPAHAGTQLARELQTRVPDIRVVAVCEQGDGSEILMWAQAGAVACLDGDSSLDDLRRAVEAAYRGEITLSTAGVAALFRLISSAAPNAELRSAITRREEEVADLAARGLSNKQIASALHVSIPTVKNHLHSVYKKLGIHTRRKLPPLEHRGAAAVDSGLAADASRAA